MPISVITNFDVNAQAPIDSRMVVLNSTDRNNIVYKYHGLKVFQTSDNSSWVWTGSTWSRELNGIYGGSGSIIGNTDVYLGFLDDLSGNKSYELNFTNTTSDSGKRTGTVRNYFVRNQDTGDYSNNYPSSSFRIEYDGDGTDGPYISLNRLDTTIGGMAFGVGYGSVNESLILRGDGRVGLSVNPSSNFQIGSSTSVFAPITMNVGSTFSSIGFNWFDYLTTSAKFDTSKLAVQLIMDNTNGFYIRTSNPSTSISTRMAITPTEISLSSNIFRVSSTSFNEISGQIRSSLSSSRTTPNYSFSNMTNGGIFLENTDINISNSGKRAFGINRNLQTIRYFENSTGTSTSYVMSGSKGVRGSISSITPNFTRYTIATFSIPENLNTTTNPEFENQIRNGKIVFIEADLIGKVTKFGASTFNFNTFRRFRFSNSYSINNLRQISLLTSTFSTLSNNVGSFGLSASISFTNPNVFSLDYFFSSSTTPAEIDTILSAIAEYKVTVINDFAEDYDVVAGSFTPFTPEVF